MWITFLVIAVREQCYSKGMITINCVKTASYLIALLFHRILRKFNQTGDKWASLPDLEDYLRDKPNQSFWLYIIGNYILYYPSSWRAHFRKDYG